MNKIFIFYHLYCINHSFELFLDALNRLIDSGLYQKTSNIYCNLVGDKKEDFLKLLSNKFKHDKKIIFTKSLDATGEGCTLDLIHKHSQNNPNSKILYMHSKGASYDDERRKTNPLCTIEFAKQWTNRMHEYLIDNPEICLQNLDKKETDGINFSSKPLPHYSGNFWWANSNYIKTLKSYTDFHASKEEYYDYRKLNKSERIRPMFAGNSKRMLSEFWLLSQRAKQFVYLQRRQSSINENNFREMNTISYFQSIPNSDFSQQSEELIEVYKQSWSKHGWNPLVLNEEYSKRNELFHKLDLDNPDANFYKTINPSNWKYHRSCYCRLLAYCQYVRENGATLYSDYDVMNYGFKPSILNFAKENSYFCGERAVVYLGLEGVEQMESALLQFSSEEFKNDASSADVYVMERYTNIFTAVYNNLENNEKAKWAYYYVGHSFDNNQDETLLVHYDGGCYRRGADRKLSRLQVIQDHNRL